MNIFQANLLTVSLILFLSEERQIPFFFLRDNKLKHEHGLWVIYFFQSKAKNIVYIKITMIFFSKNFAFSYNLMIVG